MVAGAIVEPDRLKRVEVLYGPASVMYGSDAMGGVMSFYNLGSFRSAGASDREAWLGMRGGYQSADDSWVGSAVAAWGQGAHGLLAAATFRDGHELENQAPSNFQGTLRIGPARISCCAIHLTRPEAIDYVSLRRRRNGT